MKFYSEHNTGRRTRLGVFEHFGDVVNDYWIEDGLPLERITVDLHGELPTIEIALVSYTHLTHGVRSFEIHFSLDGDEDGVEIMGNDGKTTVLRFEDKP